MAAIIEPRRLPTNLTPRPALRLVPTGGGSSVTVPVELGLRTVHLVVAVVAMVVCMALALAIGNGALAGLAPAPSAAPPAATAGGAAAGTTVVVQAGDSLWTIARRAQPSGDVRPLVDQLMAAYGGTQLQPGDTVVVPS